MFYICTIDKLIDCHNMMRSYQQIVQDISKLSHSQQCQLLEKLNELLDFHGRGQADIMEVRREVKDQRPTTCPYCKSENFIGYGKYRDGKRYKCKICNRTFTDLTGTSVSHIHKKNKWGKYLECMANGMSLRETAKEAEISYRTAFLWRHKILGSFQGIGCSKLEGIVESDETFFLFSEKGNLGIEDRLPRRRGGKASKAGINDEHVAVIVASDRKDNMVIEVAGRSRISSQKIEESIGKWIPDDIAAMCSDAHSGYRKFANDRGFKHYSINASKGQHVKEKVYHIQNVNNIHSLMKGWIKKFNGVASKYLQNYMNWFRIGLKASVDERQYMKFSLISNSAYVQANKIKTHYIIS